MHRKNGDRKPAPSPSLRDQFMKTNLDIFLLGIFVAYSNVWVSTAAFASTKFESEPAIIAAIMNQEGNDGEGATIAPTYAVLYPWFTQTISIFIYYILSRYLQFLPYVAIVFILGFTLGYSTTSNPSNIIGESALLWLRINGDVLLLIFLPGLIFLDSFTINVHLFSQAFWQLILFAFPLVLGGTSLTALVARYIFPYDWSFNLCMTFGAILSGTDPIAVAGLLDALGAPPRLKMHISGESLLNDGSAVVFYNIFTSLFFFEFGIPGFGEQIGWSKGFATFFQLAFGGAAIGLAFGMGTVFVLKLLNRRLSAEENVIQVVALISVAYLTYFVSEVLSGCSGIIATIVCGLVVKVLGEPAISDYNLALHFFGVTAQILNTLLFILGGTLWGNIISATDALGQHRGQFSGTDWGYLTILFVMLIVIRFVLVFGFYPLTANLGVGSNLREAVFMAYGGFRGSVGIALALSMYARVTEKTENSPDDHQMKIYHSQVATLFCMVGGISLFTLLIIGVTSKPLLQLLGLSTPEKVRQKVFQNYRKQMNEQALASYVRLLSQERFKGLNFSMIQEHVPLLRHITYEQLMAAVELHKSNTPQYLYSKPRLEHVIPYLYHPSTIKGNAGSGLNFAREDKEILTHRRASVIRMEGRFKWDNVFHPFSLSKTTVNDTQDSDAVNEARLNFIEILRSAYHDQIKACELEAHGELHYSLFQSLDFCEDAAAKGLPLNDWEATKVASATKVVLIDQYFAEFALKLKQMWRERKMTCSFGFDVVMFKVWMLVRQSLAFVRAHRRAQKEFEEHFALKPPTDAEKKVLDESKSQVILAETDLDDIDPMDVEKIKGHFCCSILLAEGKSILWILSQMYPQSNGA